MILKAAFLKLLNRFPGSPDFLKLETWILKISELPLANYGKLTKITYFELAFS